jgi:hypothetical protein
MNIQPEIQGLVMTDERSALNCLKTKVVLQNISSITTFAFHYMAHRCKVKY